MSTVGMSDPARSVDHMTQSIHDIQFTTIDGETASMADYAGHAVLVVNVASECGLTPQYEGLQELADDFADRGFFVIGFPCNQFMGQEPGSPDEIAEFCSATYGVTFPLSEKIDVNGDARHPIFAALSETPNEDGEAGDVAWNFEKFLVAADGTPVARFSPRVEPSDERLRDAVSALAG